MHHYVLRRDAVHHTQVELQNAQQLEQASLASSNLSETKHSRFLAVPQGLRPPSSAR